MNIDTLASKGWYYCAHAAYFDAGEYKCGLKGVTFSVLAGLNRLYWHCQPGRLQPNKPINISQLQNVKASQTAINMLLHHKNEYMIC